MKSTKSEQSIEELERLAHHGDPWGLATLATEYWRGERVTRDQNEAVHLLSLAEIAAEQKGLYKFAEYVWARRIKILCFQPDRKIVDTAFSERVPTPNGIACFAYACYVEKSDPEESLNILKRGIDLNHYGCAIRYHVRTHRGFRRLTGFGQLALLYLRAFRCFITNPSDMRILI